MPRTPDRVLRWAKFAREYKVSPDGPVTIPCGLRVDLDQSLDLRAGLYVRGHLRIVDGVDLILRAAFVYVRAHATDVRAHDATGRRSVGF